MLIYTLLRLLTPEEINDLITTGSGHKRVSLSEIMLKEFDESNDPEESEAKILPFKKKVESDDSETQEEVVVSEEDQPLPELSLEMGQRCHKVLIDMKKKHKHNLKDIFAAKRNTKKVKNTKETSLFIIEEKKKLEHASQTLKGKEIIQMYEKNAKVDINIYRNNKDDLHKSNQFGVLVNKKQA